MPGQTFNGTLTINTTGNGWCILATTDSEFAMNLTTSHPQGVGLTVSGHLNGIQASSETLAVSGSVLSASAIGIKGYSYLWDGVEGQNGGASGITPNPSWGSGVRGESQSGFGVLGLSGTGIGMRAENNSAANATMLAINHAGGNAGYFQGKIQANGDINLSGNLHVSGDVLLAGSDCAERFELASNAEALPGMVMAANGDGLLRPADTPYDPGVVGIVSGAGDFRPGITLGCDASGAEKAIIALSGRAFCKVTSMGGAIQVGDLLTTSPVAGVAMKAERSIRSMGCIIGKALRKAVGDEDLIPVLVFRQ